MYRKILISLLALFVLCVCGALFTNGWILATSAAEIKTDINQLEPAQAVMVLGARVYSTGQLSPVLEDRTQQAISVYQAGLAEKILVSGDNGQVTYNEVNAIRDYILDQDVPAQDVFTDHAGFDTYDSIYRADTVFGVNSLIISTQNTHLPRAVFIAEARGLEVQGISSDLRTYRGTARQHVREFLARPKAFVDVILGSHPKFGGQPIDISGDGRRSWDDLEV